MAIDLSSSWTTSSVVAVTSNKTNNIPIARGPDMWYDPTTDMVYMAGGFLYTFGRDQYNFDTPPSLWGFKPQSNGSVNWRVQPSNITTNVAGALTATSPTTHMSLGGFSVFYKSGNLGNLGYIAMDEVLSFSSTNGSMSNQSLPGDYYFYGQAQYVPIYGKEGLFLFLGGQYTTDPNLAAGINATGVNEAGFDKIIVYDIHTKKYFTQPATLASGSAPSGRFSFCSVGAGASDNSSYEMYV